MRIAVIDDYQRAAAGRAPWDSLGDAVQVEYFHDHVADLDALAERLAPFEAIVATRERTRFPAELLRRLPRLRLLISTGMGTAHIDVPTTRELGIVVCGTAGGGAAPVELTWALILELTRRAAAQDAAVRAGGWGGPVEASAAASTGSLPLDPVPADLAGATLGLAGLGRLGSKVAAVGAAFGMRVIAWSSNLVAEKARSVGAEAVDKATLLRESDILSVHLQLSDRTRGLFQASDLALMKPSALLINTSRGPIVDEAALIDALSSGRIGGAGLDVFDVEPLPSGHPLLRAPGAVLSPHVGYVSRNSYRAFYGEAVEDVAAFLRGAPIRLLNDPHAAQGARMSSAAGNGPVDALLALHRGMDVDDAAMAALVQASGSWTTAEGLARQCEVLGRRLGEGEQVGAWKIGSAARGAEGEIRPFGFILRSRMIASGGSISAGPIRGCALEPEVAVTFGRRLSGRITAQQARDAVVCVSPAFEVCSFRLPPEASRGLRVADGMSNWGLVIGAPHDPGIDLATVETRLTRDGALVATGGPGLAIHERAFDSIAAAAALLDERGWAFEPGQHAILGSMVPAVFVDGAATWRSDCGPLGSVELRVH